MLRAGPVPPIAPAGPHRMRRHGSLKAGNPALMLAIGLFPARIHRPRAVSHIFRTSPVERPNARETQMWLPAKTPAGFARTIPTRPSRSRNYIKAHASDAPRQAYVNKQSSKQQRTQRTRPIRPMQSLASRDGSLFCLSAACSSATNQRYQKDCHRAVFLLLVSGLEKLS
jgi:hypothetical protein